jgi:hypothetical protein
MRMASRQTALAALAVLALANGGCLVVAAGAAAGAGAAGYAYVKGKVSYTFNAALDDTWAAAHKALSELKMPVLAEERETNRSGFVRSQTGDGTPVRIYLEAISREGSPAVGTEVGVRVGTFGDYAVSDQILRQMSAHLVPLTPAGNGAAPAGSSWSAVQPQPVPPVSIQPPPPPPGIQPTSTPPGPPPTPPPPLLRPEPMK